MRFTVSKCKQDDSHSLAFGMMMSTLPLFMHQLDAWAKLEQQPTCCSGNGMKKTLKIPSFITTAHHRLHLALKLKSTPHHLWEQPNFGDQYRFPATVQSKNLTHRGVQ